MSTLAQEALLDDDALADIAEGVNVARDTILELIRSHPGSDWRPRHLIDAARKQLADHKISKTIISIAFWNMVEVGELEVDEQLIVHAAHLV